MSDNNRDNTDALCNETVASTFQPKFEEFVPADLVGQSLASKINNLEAPSYTMQAVLVEDLPASGEKVLHLGGGISLSQVEASLSYVGGEMRDADNQPDPAVENDEPGLVDYSAYMELHEKGNGVVFLGKTGTKNGKTFCFYRGNLERFSTYLTQDDGVPVWRIGMRFTGETNESVLYYTSQKAYLDDLKLLNMAMHLNAV